MQALGKPCLHGARVQHWGITTAPGEGNVMLHSVYRLLPTYQATIWGRLRYGFDGQMSTCFWPYSVYPADYYQYES